MDKDAGVAEITRRGIRDPEAKVAVRIRRRPAQRVKLSALWNLTFLNACCAIATGLFIFYIGVRTVISREHPSSATSRSTSDSEIIARCQSLNVVPGPAADFYSRKQSDRFVPGTQPILIKNATIWTGNDGGRESLTGDVLLDRGLIKWLGVDASEGAWDYGVDLTTIEANGAWLTPGIIDVHAHLAVERSPSLAGSSDGNSLRGSVQPWLRAVDAMSTHDAAFSLSIAGGVTTNLVLPGSANAIGGQGFVMKLRPTAEHTPTSMLLEPPRSLNGSNWGSDLNWRHMKHACGENPSAVYSQTRMDTFWQFREAYNKARQIKTAQDEYCEKALAGPVTDLGKFPEDLQWEALVDVLRGKVKVQTHCYEAVDLDDFVRLSNEFRFEIAAFHHAVETYLVPDVLKRAYGARPPASAIFAAFSRYKREAWRHSEFAPKILNDNGLRVVMKSDHPAIVNRYLLHEAQQAHYYGLPAHVALSSVTTTAADVLGLDHRIGYIREGYDADVVLWDSHPLALGATPVQVIIDGIIQLESPHHVSKPASFQVIPKTPNFDKEAEDTIKYEGLPPLRPKKIVGNAESNTVTEETTVIFTNVSEVWMRFKAGSNEVQLERTLVMPSDTDDSGIVVVRGGRIVCQGSQHLHSCAQYITSTKENRPVMVDLDGGSISPGLASSGSFIGLEDIATEESTTDGAVYDSLTGDKVPSILGGDKALIRAVDGLKFNTRDELLAYRAGVTSAITAPIHYGFMAGLSVAFSTGAVNGITKGSVIQDVAALHFAMAHGMGPSVSTQIAALRKILLEPEEGELGSWSHKVTQGVIPLVLDVDSADIIASLVLLKKEVEAKTGTSTKMTLMGATEAHLLAKELGEAGVGVIVNPVRPFPYTWDHRRILPGPPLSKLSAVVHLLENNVTVGMAEQGVQTLRGWSVRNMRFDIGWEAIESGGKIDKQQALALGSWNVEKLLGISADVAIEGDLVATRAGGLFDLESKVVGILSERRGQVDLL